jgi:hypothetical protein
VGRLCLIGEVVLEWVGEVVLGVGEVCWECVGDICERSSRLKAVYIACLKRNVWVWPGTREDLWLSMRGHTVG